jgi:hypothetical protein
MGVSNPGYVVYGIDLNFEHALSLACYGANLSVEAIRQLKMSLEDAVSTPTTIAS